VEAQASQDKSSIAQFRSLVFGWRSLLGSAGCLLGIEAIASLAGLAFWSAAARLYHPGQVGLASAVLAAVTLVSGIAGLGTGAGLLRFLPLASHPGRTLNSTFTLNAACAVLAGTVYLVGARIWSPSLTFVCRDTALCTGFVLFCLASALGTATKTAFVARKQAGYALRYACILNLGRLLLLYPLCRLGSAGLVGSVAAACATATTLSLFCHLPRLLTGYRPRLLVDVSELHALVPYSLGSYLAGLLLSSTRTLLPLLVVEALGREANAYAHTALMLGSLLASPAAALATAALAEGARDPGSAPDTVRPATVLALGLALPAAAIAAVAARQLLLYFGADYAREGASLLRGLAMAAPLSALKELYLARLRIQARMRRLIACSAASSLVTLSLSAALMPRHGIVGIGAAVIAGESLLALPAAVGMLADRRRSATCARPLKIALVCSHGGHLTEMELLGPALDGHRCFLITYRSPRTEALPGRRYLLPNIGTSPWRLLGACARAAWVLACERPDVVLSTGSEIAIPFLWLGRAFGARTVYVESCCRVTVPSRTGPLVYPVSDLFLVQWPTLLERYGPRAQYLGGLM
jgi:O-antigen/teichoic acid export membrane protein